MFAFYCFVFIGIVSASGQDNFQETEIGFESWKDCLDTCVDHFLSAEECRDTCEEYLPIEKEDKESQVGAKQTKKKKTKKKQKKSTTRKSSSKKSGSTSTCNCDDSDDIDCKLGGNDKGCYPMVLEEGMGDCDKHMDCRGNLLCGENNCAWNDIDTTDDCCYREPKSTGEDCKLCENECWYKEACWGSTNLGATRNQAWCEKNCDCKDGNNPCGAASEAMWTSMPITTDTTQLFVIGFAVVGLVVVLYGAGKHFFGTKQQDELF